MSFQVTEAMVQQYGTNFRTLYQQRQSRLAPWCQMEAGIVGQSKSVERIGKAEAYDITSRHADTKYVEVPHSRRWLDLQDKGWAELVDEMDKIRMLADPTSPYAGLAVMALNRQKDDIIIAAARGNARTNTGLIALPSSQKIAVGGTSLTMAKLLATKEILDTNEVDDDQSMALDGQSSNEQTARVFVVNAKMLTNLYGTTEIKSVDYNSVKALAMGQIDTFLGFKFVRSERLAYTSGVNSRFALAFSRSCMGLGIGKDIVSSIDILPGKNYSAQVYARMSIAATRLEDEGVVEVACFE
jgi:Phage capsid protein